MVTQTKTLQEELAGVSDPDFSFYDGAYLLGDEDTSPLPAATGEPLEPEGAEKPEPEPERVTPETPLQPVATAPAQPIAATEPLAAPPAETKAQPQAAEAPPATPPAPAPPPQDLLPALQQTVRATVEESMQAEEQRRFDAEQRRRWGTMDEEGRAQYLLEYHKRVAAHLKDDAPDVILRFAAQQAAAKAKDEAVTENWAALYAGLRRIPELARAIDAGTLNISSFNSLSELQVGVAEYLAAQRGGGSELQTLHTRVKELEGDMDRLVEERYQARREQELAEARDKAPRTDLGGGRAVIKPNLAQMRRLIADGDSRGNWAELERLEAEHEGRALKDTGF